ncbi:AraC family transcriptional regulator ligand-binding domain-containing protein [Xanthobacter sp. V0B-10]|uniref:helix-turn-helix domain-containing protein n=3 Tax=Xanthobacter albus TaxID=3119929 RepID=UPI0037273366
MGSTAPLEVVRTLHIETTRVLAMKKSGLVPLVRASGFGSLPQLLEERAGERALLKALDSEGLPIAVRELGGMPVPARALIGLFARAGSMLGDRALGLQIGKRMSYAGYGPWAVRASMAPSLYEAISFANSTSQAHAAAAYRFDMVHQDTHWVWRIIRIRALRGDIHHSDHQIFPMIDFARPFLGPDWWPDWIEVDYGKDPGAFNIERIVEAPVRFGRPGVGVAFSREQLAHARREKPDPSAIVNVLPRPIYDDIILPDAPEPVRSFSAIVALRLIDGQSDIDGAARIAGVGVQRLQRDLRRAGYFYREVLEIARRKRAIHLLTKTHMSIADIAASLGYEEHANFTRAFGRWQQCSPSEFRRMNGQDLP